MVSYLRNRSSLVAALCMLTPLFCVAEQATPDSADNQAPHFLSFQVPDSTAIYPQSINDLMVVTGSYTTKWGATRGFVRYADGAITTFAVPGAMSTEPVSINHAGDITGSYMVPWRPESPSLINSVQQGFVRAADGTSVLLTRLDKESKISDLPTVFLDAVTKSIGKSGEPPIATVTGRTSIPREFDGRIKFETGQIAQLDPNRPVLWERVRRGQDRIVSGRGTDVEAPGSRVGLVELERTPAQNDTVFSLQHIFPLYSFIETQSKRRCWVSALARLLVTVAALPLHLGSLSGKFDTTDGL
jgi:hypothetical protein